MKAYICFVFFVVAMCNTNGVAAKNMNLARANVKGLNFLKLKESMKILKRGRASWTPCLGTSRISHKVYETPGGERTGNYINIDSIKVREAGSIYFPDCKKNPTTGLCIDINKYNNNDEKCTKCTEGWPVGRAKAKRVSSITGGMYKGEDPQKTAHTVELKIYCTKKKYLLPGHRSHKCNRYCECSDNGCPLKKKYIKRPLKGVNQEFCDLCLEVRHNFIVMQPKRRRRLLVQEHGQCRL